MAGNRQEQLCTPNLKTEETNISKTYIICKRSMDLLLACLGVIFLLPVFITIAIIIKLEDKKGSIIFKQQRVGKDGELFYMYKFRSMVTNAEKLKANLMDKNEVDGPVFKIKNDPRITKIGKFLRKTSLDELPQLFNVIKGNMSLVGPRPPLLEEVSRYTTHERKRLSVTPGLTCYWQVGGRSNLSFEEWIELDLKYIRERNILIDIKLIFKTILVLFGSKGAF
jgi:lipopolysaccharide/colanic/teichoic acid biosynthesis glycosyltransferase